jgi:hypothetical protein
LRRELSAAIGEIQHAAAQLGDQAELPPEVRSGSLRERVTASARELEQWRVRRIERARTADSLNAEARELSARLREPLSEVRGTVREHAPLSAESLRLLDAEVCSLRALKEQRGSQAAMLVEQVLVLEAKLEGAEPPGAHAIAEAVDTCELSEGALETQRSQLVSLEATRAERAAAIAAINSRVSEICAQLGLQLDPEAARAAATDVSLAAVEGWRSELERLEKLRRASLTRLVEEAHAEVLDLWAQLGLSLSPVLAPAPAAARPPLLLCSCSCCSCCPPRCCCCSPVPCCCTPCCSCGLLCSRAHSLLALTAPPHSPPPPPGHHAHRRPQEEQAERLPPLAILSLAQHAGGTGAGASPGSSPSTDELEEALSILGAEVESCRARQQEALPILRLRARTPACGTRACA